MLPAKKRSKSSKKAPSAPPLFMFRLHDMGLTRKSAKFFFFTDKTKAKEAMFRHLKPIADFFRKKIKAYSKTKRKEIFQEFQEFQKPSLIKFMEFMVDLELECCNLETFDEVWVPYIPFKDVRNRTEFQVMEWDPKQGLEIVHLCNE